MRRLYLELKNLRFYYFVPPIILFILIPLTALAAIKSGGDFPECCMIAQLFIPSFAAWWPLFVLKEYLNSAGKELLFVHKFGRDSLLMRMIILGAFFVLHVTILFVWFTTLFDFVWFLFIAIILQSIFMISLAYFLSLLFQNTFIPMIINFAYSSIFILALFDSPLNIFETVAGSTSKSPVVAIMACILFYGGYYIEKRLYKNSI